MAYIPDSSDIVWIMFNPQAGHRPALVLSPKVYNGKVGLAILCPITSQVKGYPFEVLLSEGLKVKDAVLSERLKKSRLGSKRAQFSGKLPPEKFNEVFRKLKTLIHEQFWSM